MNHPQDTTNSALAIEGLHVRYGSAHVLQGVTLRLPENEILAVVGRNGMGKTTLCDAIMGMTPVASGAVWVKGIDANNLAPYQIAGLGVGYVPQGRRVWPSLRVDEHLRIANRRGGARNGAWNVQRLYHLFPSLAERRRHFGNQLSGGEQQMLAIARALLGNPSVLILDEPTEGLAPVVVEKIEELLVRLVGEGGVSVLLVEQNLGVAMRVAMRMAVMVNGRIAVACDTDEFATDKEMQKQLLGLADDSETNGE